MHSTRVPKKARLKPSVPDFARNLLFDVKGYRGINLKNKQKICKEQKW
ncbi:MAG: hypothetical protein GXO60_08005 [Epsilonproteobacteria bacterium]|nr:hypothetical protein [Campylobacterota bacterium]